MHTVNFLIHLVAHNQLLTYAIIYLGLVIEGEVVVISAGILAHLGALNLGTVLIFILLGGFSKTILGYALGRFLHGKFKDHKFFRYIRKRIYTILPRFNRRPFWSIFASKFIMGVNNMVIIFSGYERINYKKFLKAEVLATLIWAPTLLTLGYIFSYTALNVSRDIWKFSVVIAGLFTIFILFDKFVSWIYELIEEYYNEKS